jgi:hypothetical protein
MTGWTSSHAVEQQMVGWIFYTRHAQAFAPVPHEARRLPLWDLSDFCSKQQALAGHFPLRLNLLVRPMAVFICVRSYRQLNKTINIQTSIIVTKYLAMLLDYYKLQK